MARRLRRFERFLFKYNLVPPHRWRRVAIVAVAAFIGLGLYMLKLSNAASYLSDDPQACVNCHLMTPQYLTWTHSSHREVAHCNDCHVPHDWTAKMGRKMQASKEVWGKIFGSIDTPEKFEAMRLQLAQNEWKRLKANNSLECRNCHDYDYMDFTRQSKRATDAHSTYLARGERTCIDCHKGIAHRLPDMSGLGVQTAEQPDGRP